MIKKTRMKEEEKSSTLQTVAEFVWEMIKTAVTVVIVVFLIKTYVFQLFIVDGQSMEPTLHHNQMLLVDKLSYNIRDPHRGEIIVFQKPNESSSINFIKRIIGIPGDKVSIRDNSIFITNENNQDVRIQEEYLPDDIITNGSHEYTVGTNEIFVLGDNRTNSQDSRVLGAINEDLIVGRALFTYWPVKDAFWIFSPEYNLSLIKLL